MIQWNANVFRKQYSPLEGTLIEVARGGCISDMLRPHQMSITDAISNNRKVS